jgi:hypothetical protein
MSNISYGPNFPIAVATTTGVLGLSGVYLLWKHLFSFPSDPKKILPDPSLASLPPDSRHWRIYPEDFYGKGGAYATFPQGRVRYWLIGPEDGRKVRCFVVNPMSRSSKEHQFL